NGMSIEGEVRGLEGPTLIVGTNDAAAFLSTQLKTTNAIWISNFVVVAGANVTGAAVYRAPYKQSDGKSYYTAWCVFENIRSDSSLLVSYEAFVIGCQWNNCMDGVSGAAGSQGHGFLKSLPTDEAYNTGFQTNLNIMR